MSAPRINFAKIRGFPKNFHNGKIKTARFLEASAEVVVIVESFGKIFALVVADMRQNVSQLRSHYMKDVKGRKYLEDMFLSDQSKVTHLKLLWLNRGLKLIERFFYYVAQSKEVAEGKEENLNPMIHKAYDEALRPYHGKIHQKIFKLLNHWIPRRTTLLGSGEHLSKNIKHLQVILPRMKKHIDKIERLNKESFQYRGDVD